MLNAQQPKSSTMAIVTTSGYLEPSRNPSILASVPQKSTNIYQASQPGGLINFSEFERESDPFEKAELQTLNDMQELASVFPQPVGMNVATTSRTTTSSNTNVGIDQRQFIESNNSTTLASTSSQQSHINRTHQNTPQFSQAPHSMPIQQQPNPADHFNTYYQQLHSNSISQQQTMGSYYTPGKHNIN